MRATPPIPTWIKNYRAPDYTNIWELLPNEKKLYGTETLFGDWDGELLILLQDFSTRKEVARRITVGDPNPYRHDPTIRTNRRLEVLAAPFRKGGDHRTCGILYGSALVGLLKEGDSLSSGLGRWHSVLEYAQKVLLWTLGQMPNVKKVACCGKIAWETATTAHGLKGLGWRTHLERRIPVDAGKVLLYTHRHPVNRDPASWTLALEEWESMRYPKSGQGSSLSSPPRPTRRRANEPGRTLTDVTPRREAMMKSASNPIPVQKEAPEVTVESAHTDSVIRFYNPGIPFGELETRDHPMAPETDLDLPATGHDPMPQPGTGRAVVLEVLSRDEGASYAEVWTALRNAGIDSWNKARKLNGNSPSNGIGMVRRHGYRLTYSLSTGKYRANKGTATNCGCQ